MIAVSAFGASHSASAETLRVGTECTYHPFNYRDSDGKLQGYDVDVGNEVGTHIGADIEWVCQKWDGMIPSLLANKFDLIAASMSITDKRLKSIDFSAPYRVSIGQMIGAKGKGFEFFNADGSVKVAGFSGVRIGIERATTYDEWFKAKVPSADIAYYDTNEAMYLDLQAGRVDAIMTNPMKAFLRFLSKPDGAGFEVIGPQIAEEEYFGIDLGIDAGLDPVDYCALVPVIHGAGGAITDWEGGALNLHSGSRVLAAGDPRAHAQALEILAQT